MRRSTSITLLLCMSLLVSAAGPEKEPAKDSGKDMGKEPAKKEAGPKQLKAFRLQLCDPDEVAVVLNTLLEPDDLSDLNPAQPPAARWHVSPDPRSGVVFVRGRPEDVQLSAEIISVLESPLGKPLPKTEKIQAFKLSHANPEEITNLTDNLGIPVRLISLDLPRLVIAAGPPEALADWAAMVKEVDVPARKPDENKRRRLGISPGL